MGERIGHGDGAESLYVLEVLGQQVFAVGALSRGDDKGIPVGEAVAVLDCPGCGYEAGVNGYRMLYSIGCDCGLFAWVDRNSPLAVVPGRGLWLL